MVFRLDKAFQILLVQLFMVHYKRYESDRISVKEGFY